MWALHIAEEEIPSQEWVKNIYHFMAGNWNNVTWHDKLPPFQMPESVHF